mgnify:CR=1 FL=1
MTETMDPSEQFKSGLETIIAAFESQKTELTKELELVSSELKEKENKIIELEDMVQKLMKEKLMFQSKIKELEDNNKKYTTNTTFLDNNIGVYGSKSTKNTDFIKDLYAMNSGASNFKLNSDYITDNKYNTVYNTPSLSKYASENSYRPINDNLTMPILNSNQYSQDKFRNTEYKRNRPSSITTSHSMNDLRKNNSARDIFGNSTFVNKGLDGSTMGTNKDKGLSFFSKCKTIMDPYYYNKMLKIVKNFNHNKSNKKDTYDDIIQILRESSCMDLLDDLNQLFL